MTPRPLASLSLAKQAIHDEAEVLVVVQDMLRPPGVAEGEILLMGFHHQVWRMHLHPQMQVEVDEQVEGVITAGAGVANNRHHSTLETIDEAMGVDV